MFVLKIQLFCITILKNILEFDCHGYLIDPPSRTSAWRVSKDFPIDYNDNQMNCGGFDVEWNQNKGLCGICGEQANSPKLWEKGGSNYKGTIVKTYIRGEIISVSVTVN